MMKCWVWEGAASHGYGHVRINGKLSAVHRVSYEAIIGQIPDDLEIDHLCRNKLCYNPEHLEAVTHTENVRRGTRNKMYCPQKHPYSGRNLMITHRKSGINRRCRICHNAKSNKARDRRKTNGL